MMVNRWLQVIFLITLLSNSFLLADEERTRNELQEENAAYHQYHKYVQEIIQSFSTQMHRELSLHLKGEGGSMHNKIEGIFLDFNAYRKATLDEARAIHLYALNKLAEIINSHEKIQPFLAEKPFSYKNVEIGISFEGINGLPSDGTIARVFNVGEFALDKNKNTIFYNVAKNYLDPSQDMMREPYEEAVRKAEEVALGFPYIHQISPFEGAIDDIFLKFSSKVWLKRGLECRHIGINTPNKVEEISAQLYSFHTASQDQAREVVVYIVETLLAMFNENAEIRPYLVTYPLTSENIKLHLEFTNYKYTPYQEGIEKVILNHNELSYTHRVPTTIKTLQGETLIASLPLENEQYSEAYKIAQETPISIFQKIYNMFGTGYRWIFTPKKPSN